MASETPIRLAHFSDIHVTARSSWRPRDFWSKRLSSWLNLRVLGRGRHFDRSDEVLAALLAEWRENLPDRLLFSGDATALGFEEEVARAAEMLRVGELPGFAVPGNHDYCTPADIHAGHFERHFSPWQQGERIGGAVYPFAQRIGHVQVVGVCSATANWMPMDARGGVGREQLDRLQALLARLEPGPRLLVTHYPIARAGGAPEHRFHLLRDLKDLVAVCARGGISLWLHGHRHDAYHHTAGRIAPFPVICSGSATQNGLWSYGSYLITGKRLTASQRIFDPGQGRFREHRTFDLELPVGASR
jgi:3',5'-cyclic AMP phosphodiesterase CpdA